MRHLKIKPIGRTNGPKSAVKVLVRSPGHKRVFCKVISLESGF